jgi:hypothetical protein
MDDVSGVPGLDTSIWLVYVGLLVCFHGGESGRLVIPRCYVHPSRSYCASCLDPSPDDVDADDDDDDWLVLSNIFYFPFHIWDVILTKLTNSYFSRWLKPPTRRRR